MTSSILSQKPLVLGLQHLIKATLSLSAFSAAGLGAVEVVGDPKDAGPKVELSVPHYVAPKQAEHSESVVSEVTNNVANPTGMAAVLPLFNQNGAMSVWVKGLKLEDSSTPDNAHNIQSEEPHETSAAEAASAPQSNAHGEARILTPQMNEHTTFVSGSGATPEKINIIRGNMPAASGSPLLAAPIGGLYQQSSVGPLPIVARDGRTSFDAYKRPFSGGGAPKVAIVIGGLGLNSRITDRAIDQLPSEVTLSFVPTANNLQGWINKARSRGHEVLIEVPMEPIDYPDNDPGPQTLMANASADENQKRLEYSLSRATGYFAVTNYLGGRFATSAGVGNFMHTLKMRGVGFISDGTTNMANNAQSNGLRAANADRIIDQRPASEDISAQLSALESIAKQRGSALGFGVGYAVTIDQVANFIQQARSKGILIAPASSVCA